MNYLNKNGLSTLINKIKTSLNAKANSSDIPTKVSQLTNDSGYLTSVPSEYITETELNEAISGLGGGTGNISSDTINSIQVVDSLPETEVEGVLYLVKEEVNSGNLYDYESAPLLINAKVENSTIVTGTNDNRITYIKIEPKTTYKIEKTINDHFGVGLSTEEPVIGTVFNSYSNDETLSEVTVTSGESDNYLAIYYWTKYDTGTEEEIRKSIVVTKVLI